MSQQPPGPQQYPQHYPQQPQYAPAPPPKKKSKAPLIIGIVGAFVLLLVIGAALGGGRPPATTVNTPAVQQPAAQPPAAQQPAPPAKRVVVYEVTGTGSATSITYTTDGLTSTQQEMNVKLPWSKTIELEAGQALQQVTVVVQNGSGGGEVSAKITADGKPVKDGKSSGPYAMLTVTENIGTLGK